jgi:hypothetical protein
MSDSGSSRMTRDLADRRRDFGGGEDDGCHLIEQRLKNVVVAPIDQDDLDSATPFRRQCSQCASHSGLLAPLGTRTVLKEPGVRDITI